MENLLSDPVYDLIFIPTDYYNYIISSEIFQRLKVIEQVSYSHLLAKSPTRFQHSIGVFYLGQLFYKYLEKNSVDSFKFLEDTFYTACLLHDVGHMPYSHISEDYFGSYAQLHKGLESTIMQRLFKLIDNSQFISDMNFHVNNSKGNGLVAHEVFSVIISIESFNKFFKIKNINVELFARMVLGCCYRINTLENQLKNIFIQLLNGDGVEVDFIDCVLRGNYYTKYSSFNINEIHNFLQNISIIGYGESKKLVLDENAAIKFIHLCQSYLFEILKFQKNPLTIKRAVSIRNRLYTEYNVNPSLFDYEKITALQNDNEIVWNFSQFNLEKENAKCLLEKELKPLWKDYQEYTLYCKPYEAYTNKILKAMLEKNFNSSGEWLAIDESLRGHLAKSKNNTFLWWMNLLKEYCFMRKKLFSFIYIPVLGCDIRNRVKTDNYLVNKSGNIMEMSFFSETYDFSLKKIDEFYYIYTDCDAGLSAEEWRAFLNLVQKYNK